MSSPIVILIEALAASSSNPIAFKTYEGSILCELQALPVEHCILRVSS